MRKSILGVVVALGLIFGVFLIAIVSMREHSACGSRSEPSEQGVYVWQQQWSPALRESIVTATDAVDLFMVLGAELVVENESYDSRFPNVDWDLLLTTDRPLWIVLRAHRLPEITSQMGRGEGVVLLENIARRLLAQLPEGRVAGFQIDYDCATENLPHYAKLLKGLRSTLSGVELSITTLPTWLSQASFGELIEGLRYYVLQVHNFEKPEHIDTATTLCDITRVPKWMAKANAFGVPFYLALPTYGYQMFFDASGGFLGIKAEGAEGGFSRQVQTRDLLSDPQVIAELVHTLEDDPLRHCLGMVWFRLPVAGDRLNWSWPVLASVMQGKAPEFELRAELRKPDEGLYEVWLKNEGSYRTGKAVKIKVHLGSKKLLAYDGINNFKIELKDTPAECLLIGPTPQAGEEKITAWFRLDHSSDNNADAEVRVEILP